MPTDPIPDAVTEAVRADDVAGALPDLESALRDLAITMDTQTAAHGINWTGNMLRYYAALATEREARERAEAARQPEGPWVTREQAEYIAENVNRAHPNSDGSPARESVQSMFDDFGIEVRDDVEGRA